MKYIILIYAASFLGKIATLDPTEGIWGSVLDACTIGICCYIAGRLHRVKQNLIIMIIATFLIVVTIAGGFIFGNATIGAWTKLIIWLDICVAYFLRYKEHKEAGLMDRVKE